MFGLTWKIAKIKKVNNNITDSTPLSFKYRKAHNESMLNHNWLNNSKIQGHPHK